MPEILIDTKRKARKPHTCDYCLDTIQKGEIYDYAKLKSDYSDGIYEWKSHKKCSFIAGALWSYIDPDDGMTQEDFEEGCRDFCMTYICSQCPDADIETEKCKLDKQYCIDKIYTHLQTHEFKRIKDKHGWTYTWKCIPKGGKEDV
jgi:hypothetical protein